MSVATKTPQAIQQAGRPLRRIWNSPASKAKWYWLAGALLLFLAIFAWYLIAVRTQQAPGPFDDPLRLFGIIAFVLILGTAAYTLRRRFARGLPGKVQDWLWMHTWIGITTILLVLLHENFIRITHDYCQNLGCLTDAYWATAALIALIFLVVSGIAGRLIDLWQARVIARDASANGVGIASALEEQILELEYTVERLCAGKSEPFKQYCLQAIDAGAAFDVSGLPALPAGEQSDFRRACETLSRRAQLVQSLQRQRRARSIIRTWRTAHMVLASISLLVIAYHAAMELLVNVFHLVNVAGS
ncbi:MAG: hypothetical protein IMW89_05325 [Ktedonobacteraceae bacterium]|nr:hypothetical protein [Ktedonobacteraceae bacterium]